MSMRERLPHAPVWNLIPRRHQTAPWECAWHGRVTGALCAECRREHDAYRDTGTWDDRRYQGWSVSMDGYRLVIEGGVILGLAYGEDPWRWGDPAWIVSYLVADDEMRRVTRWPHECGEGCVCPRHGTPMFYSPRWDEHACRDVNCPYGHGVRAYIGAERSPESRVGYRLLRDL